MIVSAKLSPFPSVEEEVVGSTTTRRVTYSLAGQAIALRVQIVGGSNTLYHLHTDHLGSTRLMSDADGDDISGSITRYYPFGDWRTEPTANLTDRGYTGHQSNNLGSGPTDLGLIYMNARYYLPTIGKFASPDTLIPNPAGPQSFNRYSYVYNNPIRHTDPSGHCVFGLDTVVCILAIGAGLGLIADYAVQVNDNMENGLPFWDAVYHKNINEAEMIGAGIGGGISTGLAIVATPIIPFYFGSSTTGAVAGSMVVGGVSNAAGDFIGRISESLLGSSRDGDFLSIASYGGSTFWGAITGGVSSGVGIVADNVAKKTITEAQDVFIQQFQRQAASDLWDYMWGTTKSYSLTGDEGLELYLKMKVGPTDEELMGIIVPSVAQLIQSTARAASIALNSSIAQASGHIIRTYME